MDTFMNSEDPDEMPHYAAFQCLLGKKRSSDKKNTSFKNYNMTPLGMYTGLSKVYQTRRKDPFVYTLNSLR